MIELKIAELRSKDLKDVLGSHPCRYYSTGFEVGWRGWELFSRYYPSKKHREIYKAGYAAGVKAFKEESSKL